MKGKVTSLFKFPRSYSIKTENGKTFRRNRKHVLKIPNNEINCENENDSLLNFPLLDDNRNNLNVNENDNDGVNLGNQELNVDENELVEDEVNLGNQENINASNVQNDVPIITRSGRTVNVPQKLQDYVLT